MLHRQASKGTGIRRAVNWACAGIRPFLAVSKRNLSRVLDRLIRPKPPHHNSWYIDGKNGIADLQGAPLMGWINYHQRQILGKQCYWLGQRALKNPMDAWIYQEILYDVKPDIVLEIGNKNGGSSLFLASICELMGHGKVIALDIDHSKFTASHPRIELITGDCSSEAVLDTIREKCQDQRVLVIHDADHTKEAVLRDMRNYSPLVCPGSYFIVEDSIEGVPGFGGTIDDPIGPFTLPRTHTPLQAIEQFLKENRSFEVDASRERYILTANVRGFLKRTS